MIKKIFIVSGIIFLILGIVFFAFKFVIKKEIKKTIINNEEDSEVPIEGLKNGEKRDTGNEVVKKDPNFKINKFIEGDIESAVLNKATGEIYYYNNRNFLKTDLSGENRVSLVTYPFNDIEGVDWGGSFGMALVKDQGKYLLANFGDGEISEIDLAMDLAILGRYEDGLVYKYFEADNKTRKIKTYNLNNATQEEVAIIDERTIEMKLSPIANEILVFPSPDALRETRLSLVDVVKKDKKVIFQGRLGASFLWSPNGNKILFSYTLDNDKSTTNLGIINKDGGEFKGLNFPGLAEKCVWAEDEIHVYCASLTDVPVEMVMPNDWLSGSFKNADSYWKINTKDGKKERAVTLEELGKSGRTYDGYNFFFDNDKRRLFFIDKEDNDLYQIDL